MDDSGNIEPSQASLGRAGPDDEPADAWGSGQDDDQDYLESLEDFEQTSGEISDQLLLRCMADFDSH